MRAISVVIPVYNGERYLADAMTSVLSQTYAPAELIVVDDGSTDASGVIAKHYASDHQDGSTRVCYVRQAHAGQPTALNLGVRVSRGSHLAFLDADDTWPGDKLDHQVAAFEARPDVHMVFGHARQFRDRSGETPRPLAEHAEHLHPPRILPAKVPGALLMRRGDFDMIGPFREDLKIGSAIEWYARARDAGLTELILDDIVLERRVHGENLTLTACTGSDYATVIRAILNRRRSSAGGPH
jgi:glycosyltransferase involved in cell wall biosynthesis